MSPDLSESPFADLLDTNYVPSEPEAYRIHDMLIRPVTQLSYLNAEIARLQTIIDGLTHERDKIKNYVDAHRGLLSPARRLPPEVVGEIFVHCLPTERNPVRSVTEAPLMLGRICSAWRHISLSTPRLWASIHIVIPTYYDPSQSIPIAELRCESIKVWFARSGVLPLSISIASPDNGYTVASASPLLEFLIQFSRRWKRLDVRLPSTSQKPFARLAQDDVPLLEAIKIEDVFTWNQSSHWDFPILRIAPRLRSVSMLCSQEHPRTLTLPWAQLTQLSLDNRAATPALDVNKALALLQQCRNLERCTLGIRSLPLNGFVLPSEPLTLPNLHTFHLHPDSDLISANLQYLFDWLVLPRLQELAVVVPAVDSSYNFNFSPPSHVPFISTLANTSLLTLTLSHLRISQEALIECLQLLPSLTTLCIDDWISTPLEGSTRKPLLEDQVLGLLTPSQTHNCLCPYLEVVKFTQCSAFSDQVLLNFVRSRYKTSQPGISRLSTVDIRFSRLIAVDIMPQVQLLREEGLRFFVHYSVPRSVSRYSDSPWEGLINSSDDYNSQVASMP